MKQVATTTHEVQSESPLYDDVRNAEWLMSSLGLVSGPVAERVKIAEESWVLPDGTTKHRREVDMTLPGVEMLRAFLPNQR
jgi:hypothetical protein